MAQIHTDERGVGESYQRQVRPLHISLFSSYLRLSVPSADKYYTNQRRDADKDPDPAAAPKAGAARLCGMTAPVASRRKNRTTSSRSVWNGCSRITGRLIVPPISA